MDEKNLPYIRSSDSERKNRVPPRQKVSEKWPVLHFGSVPQPNLPRWRFHIFGQVEHPWECTLEEFRSLPALRVLADMHCVTTWSKLENLWEGVSTRTVLEQVKVKESARFVIVHAEHGFTANLALADFLADDCLFAWSHNGTPLSPDHGYPLRLVVPKLYAWKSVKWVRGLELTEEDRPGFWEKSGYHMRGDPWAEQRFRDD